MKLLFLQEYIRENHMRKEDDDSFKNIFFSTRGGQLLRKLIEEGLDLKRNQYYIDYAYSMVPQVIQRDNYNRAIKYKPPTQTEANAEYKYLYERIVKEKPDIIIPSGNLGCRALLGRSAITQLRGVPEKVTVEWSEDSEEEIVHTHDVWVLPMYSMEYMLVNPSIQNLIEADFVTLKKFVDEGEKAFQASPVDYEFVDKIDRVREIFTKDIKTAPIVSWDLETNTLNPELPGAKPLVIALSWEEGTGCTIPLQHKEFTWKEEELTEIYSLIQEFLADPDTVKVGHNIQFDIRFLRLTNGFTQFKNNRDTKVMYYLLINQDVEGSLKLSDMAYELTDMGGYDRELEDYKREYVKNYIANERERIKNLRAEHKKQVELERKQAQEDGVDYTPPQVTFPKAEAPKNEIDGSDFNYEWFPFDMLSQYASGDVDAGLRIHNQLDGLGTKKGNEQLRKLYTDHYTDLTNYLASIEANGIKMNIEYNEELTGAYIEEEDRIVEEMRKFPEVKQLEEEHRILYERGLAEWAIPKKDRDEEVAKLRDRYKNKLKFNPNSPDDKKKVMYQIPGITLPFNREYLVDSAVDNAIPEEDIEWRHYKTNKTALEYVKAHNDKMKGLADMLLTHSLVKTRRQGFTYKLRGMVDPDGLLHGGFNNTGTATSRLSSQSPNLQQLPRNTGNPKRFDYKYPIKRMFVTRFEGGALLQMDYSSLESRVLALAAGDDEMTQAFLDNGDIHKETASITYGIPIEKVTNDMREMAKAVTFGIAYGETPFSFAPKHDMSVQEAEDVFEKYFQNKPNVKAFIDRTHEQVKRDGFVETLHGFRRNLRDVYSQDRSKQNEALRQSVNTKIQGSGAFLTNSSVIYIHKWLEQNNLRSKIILTVHDSIVIDCPPEEVHIVAQAARYIMENLPIDWLFVDWKGEKMRYPIAADVEIGVTYNDMVDYDKEELDSFSTIANYCKYHLDLRRIEDYKNSDMITEDKFEELTQSIEGNKNVYQSAS